MQKYEREGAQNISDLHVPYSINPSFPHTTNSLRIQIAFFCLTSLRRSFK